MERSPLRLLNALETRLRRNVARLATGLFRLRTRRSTKVSEIFSFHVHFRFVEDRSGGIYLSGQTSNPANSRHLRIDSSIGIGRSFSEFRTCCVGQKCASSIMESCGTEECTSSGKTRDLGSESTSIEALSLRRRPQIIRRSRLRLFRHDLLCSGRSWFD